MNIKIKHLSTIFITIFVLGMGFLPNSVFAETSPSQCPASNPDGTVDCVSGKHYAGSLCRLDTDIQGVITSCSLLVNKEYSCASNTCVCKSGFCLNGTVCQSSVGTGVCDGLSRITTNTCTGICGSCKPTFEEIAGLCQGSCAAGSLRTSAGCISMETVASLLAPVFGTTLANFLTDVTGVITKITDATYGIDYYVLTATGRNDTTKVSNYQYGGLKPDVWLVSDWADGAWLAQNLNWDNIPISIATLFQNLAGVTFCSVNADCTGGTCTGGICTGSVVAGGVCNDTNLFCVSPLICDEGICKTASSKISPADITPGDNGQVLTTVSGVTSWADVAGGGVGQAVFVGITPVATYTGNQNGYKLANDRCFLGTGVLEGSHICTPSEIIHSYETNVPAITSQAGIAWFNTGSPSNFVPLVSDCKGWKDGTANYFGNVWNFDIDAGGVQGCNSQKAFACCK